MLFRSAGATVSALVIIATLQLINPDAVIARNNFERMADGKVIDISYLGRLSADATPAIVERLDTLTPGHARSLVSTLERREQRRPSNWRAFNFSRHMGANAIANWRTAQP